MATTHLIAINGDYLVKMSNEPELFTDVLHLLCSKGGAVSTNTVDEARARFGLRYITESMNGIDGALKRATGGK